MRHLALLAAVLVLAACDTADPTGRTYPLPGAYEAVPIEAMPTIGSGTYNTEGVVGAITECPDGSQCLVPDSIDLGQHAYDDPPQLGIRILADQPSQFEIGGRYRVSVEAFVSGGARSYELLGYERLD